MIVGCNYINSQPSVDNEYYSSDPNKYNLLVLLDASKSSETDWYKWEDKNNLFNVIDKINGIPTSLTNAQ